MAEAKTYAVLTSGGDSPGMNCAIRAIARTLISMGHQCVGIRRGYSGLLEEDFMPLTISAVGNIIQHGGTILRTSRCPEFTKAIYRKKAHEILKKFHIDGLIVIGGDGSFKGAFEFFQEHQFPIIGIPGTIDNDISGTEYTIGYDTAVQTGIEAVDRIRDTALSHDRVFMIEVMGRNSSALALKVGLCTGAEYVISPSEEVPYDIIKERIERGIRRGKNSSIFIVAEGKTAGRTYSIQDNLHKNFNIDAHVCILGHIQRGGSPTSNDRSIATLMGHLAAQEICHFTEPKAAVVINGKTTLTHLSNCLQKTSGKDHDLLNIISQLSI